MRQANVGVQDIGSSDACSTPLARRQQGREAGTLYFKSTLPYPGTMPQSRQARIITDILEGFSLAAHTLGSPIAVPGLAAGDRQAGTSKSTYSSRGQQLQRVHVWITAGTLLKATMEYIGNKFHTKQPISDDPFGADSNPSVR